MPNKRLFIAADISDEQRATTLELIEDLQKGIRFTKAHPKWVEPESLHLTVKFLGSIPSERVEKIIESIRPRLAGYKGFHIALKGLGVFPDESRPKVLWFGVKPGKRQLAGLSERIDSALGPLGFEPERREFHPHLTLARIKAVRGAEPMMDVIYSHRHAETSRSLVDSLTLYESELSPEGPTYTALHKWPLEKPEFTDIQPSPPAPSFRKRQKSE